MVHATESAKNANAPANRELDALIKSLEHESESALQRALLARGLRILLHARSRKASFIEKALGASDEGEFLTILAEELSPAETSERPAITESLRRGIALRNRLLAQDGGCATADEAAALAGLTTRQGLYAQMRRGAVLAVPVGERGRLFPAWQFRDGRPLPGLAQVLSAFHYDDPWRKFFFFLSSNHILAGRRPLDVLREGDVQAVVSAASAHGEQGGR